MRLWMRGSGVRDPRAWVFRCGFHLATSSVRRRLAERRATQRMSAAVELGCVQTGLLAAQVDLQLDLHRAVAALPVRQRQAILLRYLADLNVPEVARVMGCSTGTVKAHVARGLAALRSSGLVASDDEYEHDREAR